MDGDPLHSLSWWILVLLFGILAILSGLFSGAEVAVFALGRAGRLRRRMNGGRYARVRRLLDRSERTLATIKLGTLILNLAAALLAVQIVRLLWSAGGIGALWTGLGVAGIVLLVVGAAFPRALAIRWPEGFALRASPFLELAGIVLAPLRWPVQFFAARLAPVPLSSQQISRSIQGEEEFKALLSTSEVSGLLQEDEREMIDSVFEFAETTADEIMTPRTDIEGYPVTCTQEEILDILQQSPYSRVVIYEDNIDEIVGVLHAKAVLLNPEAPWREFVRKPLFVPSAMELDDLLTQFKRSHSRLAIVLDEFGGTAGLVTMHDLLEEIVGEMPEEEEQYERDIDPIEPGTYLVAGRVEIADCNDLIGTSFPEDKARTVAGLVFTHLGEVPEVGAELSLANARVRVIELEENRIEWLEVHVTDGSKAPEPATDAAAESERPAAAPGRDQAEALP